MGSSPSSIITLTDVAIIDGIWNGLNESLKIAAMADVYEINVAPHNFYGHLCSAISATFSAVVPNFRVMEIDIDSAPWRDRALHGGSRRSRTANSFCPRARDGASM